MSRNYRIGQTKDVRVIIAVARDTIEHKVIQVLEDKQGLHDVLIDGTNRKSLPLAELLAMELRR
jgi:SNF2 family DNA or RNA helicase